MSNPYAAPNAGDTSQGANSEAQQGTYAAPTEHAAPQAEAPAPQPSTAQYSQSPYPSQGQGYSAVAPFDVSSAKSNATIALVLGILGIIGILPLIGPIVSWVWGGSILKKAAAAGLPAEAVSPAKWAKIIGIIGTVLAIIAIVLIGIFVVIFIQAAINNPELFIETDLAIDQM